MSEIQKQLEIKELVDNTPVREKLLELKNWEKTMKVKEKELKLNGNKSEVSTITLFSSSLCLLSIDCSLFQRVTMGY